MIEAEQAEDDEGVTQLGSRALTPDYASPEQILDGKVTVASDVYSLGVLTYQLLAGDLPYRIERSSYRAMVESVDKLTVPRASTRFRSNTDEGRDREIANRRSTTPARMVRALAGDLDTILMKALHKEPERRYPSVEAFSADLDRYSRGMPVEAQDDSWSYRASRFIQRNRLAVDRRQRGASVTPRERWPPPPGRSSRRTGRGSRRTKGSTRSARSRGR